MMRRTGIAFLWGLAAMWLVGCNKPCATTSDCNQGDVEIHPYTRSPKPGRSSIS